MHTFSVSLSLQLHISHHWQALNHFFPLETLFKLLSCWTPKHYNCYLLTVLDQHESQNAAGEFSLSIYLSINAERCTVYILMDGWIPFFHQKDTTIHTHSHLRPIYHFSQFCCLPNACLNCERKSSHMDKTHSDMGRTCTLHIEKRQAPRGFKPGTLLL